MSYIAEGSGPDIRPGERCDHIPPTVVVFYGAPKVFFVAICEECEGPKPQPFGTQEQRDRWVEGHSTVHKRITTAVEVRP